MANETQNTPAPANADLLRVLTALEAGDFTQRMAAAAGDEAQIGVVVNALADKLERTAAEMNRITRQIGVEGLYGGQAEVEGLSGQWLELVDGLNRMAENLTAHTRLIASGVTRFANGDFSQKVECPAPGELGELRATLNTMMDQFNAFTGEIMRLAGSSAADAAAETGIRGLSGAWSEANESIHRIAGAHPGDRVPGSPGR